MPTSVSSEGKFLQGRNLTAVYAGPPDNQHRIWHTWVFHKWPDSRPWTSESLHCITFYSLKALQFYKTFQSMYFYFCFESKSSNSSRGWSLSPSWNRSGDGIREVCCMHNAVTKRQFYILAQSFWCWEVRSHFKIFHTNLYWLIRSIAHGVLLPEQYGTDTEQSHLCQITTFDSF